MGRPSKYTPEFREEAVRLHREQGTSVAERARRLGLGAETFRKWVRQAEVNVGERVGATREDRQVT
jgi:transposase